MRTVGLAIGVALLANAGVDTGMSGEPGPAEFFVGWHGYTQCRQPALEILVVADGCAPKTVTLERQKHSETSGLIDVALDCG